MRFFRFFVLDFSKVTPYYHPNHHFNPISTATAIKQTTKVGPRSGPYILVLFKAQKSYVSENDSDSDGDRYSDSDSDIDSDSDSESNRFEHIHSSKTKIKNGRKTCCIKE